MGDGTGDKTHGKVDEMKGGVKRAVGDALDDESLEREGRTQQTKGKGKEALGNVKDAGQRLKEGAQDALD